MHSLNPATLTRSLQMIIFHPLKAFSLLKKKLKQPRVPENSSYCYFVENEELSTVIYLYNYWSENYKIERPEIKFHLLDMEGNEKGTHVVFLSPNGCAAVKGNDLLSAAGIQSFEGSVLTTITHPLLVQGRPLQMNVDYFFANGKKVTGVHSQWGINAEPKDEVLASFHVQVHSDRDTFVVFRNTLHTKHAPRAEPVTIELLNHKGEKKETTLSTIPPMGMRKVSVRELFPESDSFLDGKPGNLNVTSHTEMGRCLFYHHDANENEYTFNHATQNLLLNGNGFYTLDEMKRMGIGPVGAGPVRVEGKWDTYLLPFVDFFEDVDHYFLDLCVFDHAGKKILERPQHLKMTPRTVTRIDFNEVLSKGNVPQPFSGSFRLSFHIEERTPKYPKGLHYIAGFSHGNHHTEFQFDSGLFNMPTHNLSNEYQTSKIFSRALSTNEFQTSIFLINSSGETGYAKESKTQLYVFDAEGKTIGEKTIKLPANGSQFISLEEEFPNMKNDLSSCHGNGVIKVRDRTTRISGFHFIQDRKGNFQCSDHLVGG